MRAPPPPPPPPKAGIFFETKAAPSGGDDPRAGLMNALNRGSDVTSGLRKVTADMKTKNQKDHGARLLHT